MRRSLSLKIASLMVLALLVVAGSTSALVFHFAKEREQELIGRDRELAQVLAGLRDERGRLVFSALVGFVGSSDAVDTGLAYAMEMDGKGQMLQGALNPRLFGGIDPSFQDQVQRLGRKQVLVALGRGAIDRKGLIKQYAMPIPGGELRLGFDMRRIDERLARERHLGLGILGAGLLLGIAIALLVGRQVSRPIRKLAQAMDAVARGDLDQTVQVTSGDELASLADSFNQMMRSLRSSEGSHGSAAIYLSEPIWSKLRALESPLNLPAEDRAATVLCLRVDGLAACASRLSPKATLGLANDYLAPALDALLEQGAEVFWIAEDRLQACWGAVCDVPDGELRACQGALAARDAMEREGRRQAISGRPVLQAAIGIASGRVAVGNTGSSRRAALAVTGVTVEQARQAEGSCRAGEVVVSEPILDRLGGQLQAQPFGAVAAGDDELPTYLVQGLQRRS